MCVGSFLVINIYNIWYTCIQAVCRERERERHKCSVHIRID